MRRLYAKIQEYKSKARTKTFLAKVQEMIPPDDSNDLDRYFDRINETKEYADFINKLSSLCKTHCQALPFPTELSSKLLKIKREQQAFIKANGGGVYEVIVHLLQVAMLERYCVEKFKGVQITPETKDSIIASSSGCFIGLDYLHTEIFALDEKESFISDANEYNFYPQINIKSNSAVVKHIVSFLNETPFARLIEIEASPEKLKRSCEYFERQSSKGKIKWDYEPAKFPSHQNCHGLVYSVIQHMLKQPEFHKDKVKDIAIETSTYSPETEKKKRKIEESNAKVLLWFTEQEKFEQQMGVDKRSDDKEFPKKSP